MRSLLTVLTFVFFSFARCFNLEAEPANVLVGNLTFTRPATWTWAEPTKTSTALTRFVIPGPGGGTSQTDVRFYIIKKEISAEKASLLQTFPQASATDLHEEQIKIGKQKIIYFTITGTYKFKDNKPRPDQLWVSAAIPSGKQFIYVRLQGPRHETEGSVPVFKQMVENAVRERELN